MTTAGQFDPEAQVRALWAAYARGGPRAMRELAPEDTEWMPLSGGGERVRPDQFTGDWARAHVERVSAVAHGFETRHGHVLAHGSLRVFRDGGFFDVQPSWVFFFQDRRLRRAVGYTTREEALEAIEAQAA